MANSKTDTVAVEELEDRGDTSTALAVLNGDGDDAPSLAPSLTPVPDPDPVPVPVQLNGVQVESTQVSISSLLDELGRLNDLDRQRLGALLRRGQRLALHVQSKVALPEFTTWAQDVQHFMNEFGV